MRPHLILNKISEHFIRITNVSTKLQAIWENKNKRKKRKCVRPISNQQTLKATMSWQLKIIQPCL